MDIMRPYSHRAVEWRNDLTGARECRLCPRGLTGWGETLRHDDEAFRPAVIADADAAAFALYVDVGTHALESMLTDRCTDRDRARAVLEALYRQGALNVGRRRRAA